MNNENIENLALLALIEKKLMLATAESCTGGLLAYHITKQAGASRAFLGGIISYANDIKERCLKVDSRKIESYGAISTEVVEEMLNGVLGIFNADVALATSGVAGPSGGDKNMPIGSVCECSFKMLLKNI